MRVEFLELHPNGLARSAADARAPGGLRFGNTIVRLGTAALPIAEAAVAGRRTAEVSESERLFVVVQKGRIFQQENPDVEVVLDHGRYLLVKLGASESARLQTPEEPCYAVMPAKAGQVIYERLARPAAVAAAAPAAVDLLSRETFTETLRSLTGLHSRFSTSAGYRQAVALCRESLESFGFETVEQAIAVPGVGPSSNLIARKSGSASPAVLVTAHLDSVNIAGGPDALAPGADDDGSGSAGVVTLAQAIAAADGADGADGVAFILFGGEEQGLLGSKHFVQAAEHFDRAALRAVINMDMIASINPPAPGGTGPLSVLLEGAEVSRKLVDNLADAAFRLTTLEVSRSFNPFASDHVSFIDAGIPAVLTIEGEDSSNNLVHTAGDTFELIDPDLAMQILRMNMGAILANIGQ